MSIPPQHDDKKVIRESEYATVYRWMHMEVVRLHTCPVPDCGASLGDPRFEDDVEAPDRHFDEHHNADDLPIKRVEAGGD